MYEEQVKQKVTLLCLMNLAAELPATERTIPFAAITARTQLPATEVEWLLMRAMSLGLVKGTIDEVDQVVEISYVKVGGLAECLWLCAACSFAAGNKVCLHSRVLWTRDRSAS